MAFVENVTVQDLAMAIRLSLVNALNHQIASENVGGRLRVVLDAGPGAQTLGTVTTVTTVSGVSAIVGMTTMPAMPYRDAIVTPQERMVWQNAVRARIS